MKDKDFKLLMGEIKVAVAEEFKWDAVRHDIIMGALKLAKSLVNWKTGKGSIRSFSKAKTKFVDMVDDNIQTARECLIIQRRNDD